MALKIKKNHISHYSSSFTKNIIKVAFVIFHRVLYRIESNEWTIVISEWFFNPNLLFKLQLHRFKGKIMLWRSNLSSKTCQLQKWYGGLKSQKWCWLVSVCLSNHDKSFISQKLKYQVKTPSKHNIAWIASFKGLQAFRFFQVCLQFL